MNEQIKEQIIGKLITRLVEENFPVRHLNAVMCIVALFNHSEAAEEDVLTFVAELCNKYEH